MKKYTVTFLFNRDLSKVLLIKKNRTCFKGSYNGVGGKVEPSDTSNDKSAKREVREETGAAEFLKFFWVGTLTLPWDCEDEHLLAEIHFYGAVIEDCSVVHQTTDESLRWWDTIQVLTARIGDKRFAGNGDVQYFIGRCVASLG